ncbi:hypothetical protein B0T22DRAFT_31508 [Podospora appendiculata]|uniref:Serine/threonine-protein kinase ppk6 n=1 Tax=Podospora appendiculata TaxID=314037 RepID=A0AAE0XGM6_9PEZI|nr:hypothetical protein B0T22DRAFT_31508 [Podospora appendiculata]
MSADLFAAFESVPQASGSGPNSTSQQKRPQYGGIPATAAADDPFSFLTTPSVSAPQSQQRNQQSTQWPPPLQQQTESPASLWPTLQSNQHQTQQQTADVWGDFSGPAGVQSGPSLVQQTPVKPDEDEDGWGDFEVASPETSQPPAFPESLSKAEPPRTRVVRAQTMDLIANKLVDVGITPSGLDSWQERPSWEAPTKAPAKKPDSQKPKPNADPNVLFDVDDFELHDDADNGDDDLGDFESEVVPSSSFQPSGSSPGSTQPKKQPPGLMLSSSRTTSDGSLYPQAPKSPYGSFQTRKPDPVKQLRVRTPLGSEFPKEVKQRSPSPVTAWPTVGADASDNDWAEFEDLPAENKPRAAADSLKMEIFPPKPAAGSALAANDSGPPPTNVPPPSVLLSVFPQLLDLANTSLLKPISTLPASGRQAVASNAATVLFLRGHLALATVAARIIAGRKQRWHRDKFLMQSMSISAAGGKGGMKLAGVDKTQSAREDREAAELLSVWQQQVGRLRSAVAAANQAAAGSGSGGLSTLRVPELSINVSAHAAPLVATAPKPCVICGLKRDERIPKVDVDVEDSFGEWWVDYWGHRACRNFWLEHEVKLRQR